MSESPTPRIRSGSAPVARRTATRPGRVVVVADGIVVEVAAVAAGAVVDEVGVVAGTVLAGTLAAGAMVDEPASSRTEPTTRVV